MARPDSAEKGKKKEKGKEKKNTEKEKAKEKEDTEKEMEMEQFWLKNEDSKQFGVKPGCLKASRLTISVENQS